MEYIKSILLKENPSLEELVNCFEKIKENKEVAVIKFDGERSVDEYTVFILTSKSKSDGIIRADESNLKKAIIKVLDQYIELNQ